MILYKSDDIYAFQPFDFEDWTGGSYAVPTVLGSRPGGAVAAAWATIRYLGLPGYLELTRRCLAATQGFMDAVTAVEGFYIEEQSAGELALQFGWKTARVHRALHRFRTSASLDLEFGGQAGELENAADGRPGMPDDRLIVLEELAGDSPPKRLAPIFRKALADEPAKRWQSAGELRQALEAARQKRMPRVALLTSIASAVIFLLWRDLAGLIVAFLALRPAAGRQNRPPPSFPEDRRRIGRGLPGPDASA